MSILQGGSGFPVMHPAAYHYFVTGEYLGLISNDDDVPDPYVRELLKQVNFIIV